MLMYNITAATRRCVVPSVADFGIIPMPAVTCRRVVPLFGAVGMIPTTAAGGRNVLPRCAVELPDRHDYFSAFTVSLR